MIPNLSQASDAALFIVKNNELSNYTLRTLEKFQLENEMLLVIIYHG